MSSSTSAVFAFAIFSIAFAASASSAEIAPPASGSPQPDVPGQVLHYQKISHTAGGFVGGLEAQDRFGYATTGIGDLDGNGVGDLVVSAPFDVSSLESGVLWLLLLHPNGTVAREVEIRRGSGGFSGVLDPEDFFGFSVAALGDLDGDGVTELAVGAPGDDDGGQDLGAVWILFLAADGTVKDQQKISATSGGSPGPLEGVWGASVAPLGDLDGNGLPELAVGAPRAALGTSDPAVWILFLAADGTVTSHQQIDGPPGDDSFGVSLAPLGDLNGDGARDLAVGAHLDDDGLGDNLGAVWILFLAADGTLIGTEKISAESGDFTGFLDDGDQFGRSLSSPGDLDCDGTADLLVGAISDDDGGPSRGAVWVLFLETDGHVAFHGKISSTSSGFAGALGDDQFFGYGVSTLGDLDRDGNPEIAVGAIGDDDGSLDAGAAWTLFLDGGGCYVTELFRDGFESGSTGRWSAAVP